MAGDHHRKRGHARHEHYDDSQYPPVPGEEDERSRAIPHHPRPQMASAAVTLPSIQDPHATYGPGSSRSWDSRTSGYGPSPTSTNGYPPPPGSSSYSPVASSSGYPTPGSNHQPYLPPVHAHASSSRGGYPADPRASQHYAAPAPGSYNGASAYDYAYQPERGPHGGYADYAGPSGAAVMQQSAPRQRTSIACKYCRRRKIRCSGFQNSPGGKCTNCLKMNQECLFQPVSSSSSAAFVSVSALTNGISPGMQIYGAYGQPLTAASNHPHGGGGYVTTPQYDQPLPSPTGSYASYTEERVETGRRRHRTSDDDHGLRLPPPSSFPEDGTRRRSPSSSSPGHLQPYPQIPAQPVPPYRYDNRTPEPRGSPSGPPAGGSGNSVMSLGNIMDGPPSARDIDQNMLGRLNRRKHK
ncbi:Uu.00g109870.m01.CDS01 [Anthostomella pinea]|uniref:Uu.00g109870.m01.CDS01 n=1 Tax=Anthostomella pinea TaxID=933095 RepID=A0AAI8VFU2_9PEZI|nr:Uu.00g109870.m01.CDS01 [Anthostomella pinea]